MLIENVFINCYSLFIIVNKGIIMYNIYVCTIISLKKSESRGIFVEEEGGKLSNVQN